MTKRPHSRRLPLRPIAGGAALCAVGVAWLAPAQTPAPAPPPLAALSGPPNEGQGPSVRLRLLPAPPEAPLPAFRASEKGTREPVFRGFAPEAGQPVGSLASPTPVAIRPLSAMSPYAPVSARNETAPVVPPPKPNALESAWSSMKGLVAGKSERPVNPPAAAPAATLTQPGPPAVYAGQPAFRWYGWGTTTPGKNPHAPAGQYPYGSANWYAQTGATPGAFPVSATPGPGERRDAPDYAAAPAPTPVPLATMPHMATPYPMPEGAIFAAPVGPPIHVYPPDVFAAPPPMVSGPPVMGVPVFAPPQVTATPSGPGVPVPQVPTMPPMPAWPTQPPMFGPTPGAAPIIPPAVPQQLSWQVVAGPEAVAAAPTRPAANPIQPAAATAPVSAPPAELWAPAPGGPVNRGQMPADPATPTVEQQVRSAAAGFATVTEVTYTGMSRLRVRFGATNEAEAAKAVEAVSRLKALARLTVDFEATLPAGR